MSPKAKEGNGAVSHEHRCGWVSLHRQQIGSHGTGSCAKDNSPSTSVHKMLPGVTKNPARLRPEAARHDTQAYNAEHIFPNPSPRIPHAANHHHHHHHTLGA